MIKIEPKKYVEEQLKKGAKTALYAKTARIQARVGIIGEIVTTVMKDGLKETQNQVKEKGDMVATNPGGEHYIIDAKTFAKKYELDPANKKLYRPKGGAQKFLVVKEDVEFVAPWGEKMNIKAGGVLNITNLDDIYGIQKDEFEQTYALCDKNGVIVNLLKMKNSRGK